MIIILIFAFSVIFAVKYFFSFHRPSFASLGDL